MRRSISIHSGSCRDGTRAGGKPARRLASSVRQMHFGVPARENLRLQVGGTELPRTHGGVEISDERFDDFAGGEQHSGELIANGKQMGGELLSSEGGG